MKLLIITPFKNEEDSIGGTIASIVKQSIYPVAWLLMDDGSDDSSPEIVKDYAKKYSFIHYYRREKTSSTRATGNNVVELFNLGLQVADTMKIDWDIVSKLDADLVIQRNDYIEFMLSKFEQYPSLGIASGVTFILGDDNTRIIESKHKWHTQGPNKFYRKECLHAIGGLRPFKGWDGIDDILARDKGYITEKFFEQDILHLYPTQTRQAEGGFQKGLSREAYGYRNMGYPFYMYLFKAMKLVKERGIQEGSLFFYYGIKATLQSQPLVSKEESRIVKKFMAKRIENKFIYTNTSTL
ncbi:glycosyltransferase family 2 protein [Arcticibacter eurypsychrophilus]|uniref:glycosyltransferase family 2 protein n=1 Tax=Arcticibacter eurypsychrophilus TaxID=1434752 RepID=UPI0014799474|nr:glycosyltransferase family A protein [Arcticibacter eurypsychrophilus]